MSDSKEGGRNNVVRTLDDWYLPKRGDNPAQWVQPTMVRIGNWVRDVLDALPDTEHAISVTIKTMF